MASNYVTSFLSGSQVPAKQVFSVNIQAENTQETL
jgi:hypothetical protein